MLFNNFNMKISVVVPVYNEESTLPAIHQRITKTQIPDEIIYVNDGSKNRTRSILDKFSANAIVKVITCKTNYGKGKALAYGIQAASGELIILQDADLEYDPVEYPRLIAPFSDKRINIVYGARFTKGSRHAFYLPHYIANRLLTGITNLLYGCRLNDMETGYKVFRKSIFNDLHIKALRFEFEPEFTAKALLSGHAILEVPISFNPRNYKQGKKIKFHDAITAIWTLISIRFNPHPFSD